MTKLRPALPSYIELRAGGVLVVIEARTGERPVMLYAGADIAQTSGSELALLATRQHAPGSPSVPLRGSLLNEIATGASGAPGLLAHRRGRDWAIDLRVASVELEGSGSATIFCNDLNSGIAARHDLSIEPETGILQSATTIENEGDGELDIEWCAALCLPFDVRLTRFMSFTGKWAGEFAIEEIPAFQSSIVRENRSGRTSHHSFPGGILAAPETTETSGPALAFHLAWSGNHRLRIERTSDTLAHLQAGELLLPGEVRLAKGESYRTPDFLTSWSNNGMNTASQAFHAYLSKGTAGRRTTSKPRPVHYNTWEAVYFGHDEATLIGLAERAAEVGAERFVLDDGWFGSRRHDGAGLGDWWVSRDIYPQGLHPLVNRVRELGMEFGLWFEPEMVNPDSDLFRAHPDWVLGVDGVEPIPSRNQLTLDLTRSEVREYLFERMSALVGEYEIDYIKWDMNRDTHVPGSGGRPEMRRQTQAVYALMDDLRAAHPELEIETCSSGGARADFGIMRSADRIWTSDNNDARKRHEIMRGASHFFPLWALGNHVGPRKCHITGRRFDMAFRVGTAMLGHMGMELDLRAENDADLAVLKAGIALHKKHRNLIHEGRFHRLASAKSTNLVGTVAHDRSEALFSYAVLDTELTTLPQRIVFGGLDDARRYRVRLVWPQHNPSISTPSILDAADLGGDGHVFSGAALMTHGMQPPLTFPDTCLIYHLEACE
ncbi:alpha-galactosidase [Erythrobacter rubeus]|uniref:alpha-galactosidase n=1 Tax=Erythrobacter rubeus TaxID=2760803 RepID=A0ABR8KPJ2_9SPHN|nr:alpha-galactosidase [Erythrobacter rubeus]MBD2841190.1 alpha-galactosidase [Erythrobacter rubeus]